MVLVLLSQLLFCFIVAVVAVVVLVIVDVVVVVIVVAALGCKSFHRILGRFGKRIHFVIFHSFLFLLLYFLNKNTVSIKIVEHTNKTQLKRCKNLYV